MNYLDDLLKLASLENKEINYLKEYGLNSDIEVLKSAPSTYSFYNNIQTYNYLLDEFNGTHNLFGSIQSVKKHKNKIQTVIDNLKESKNIFGFIDDKKTIYGIEKLIKILELMQTDVDVAISKLIYFHMVIKSKMFTKTDSLLFPKELLELVLKNLIALNPFDDTKVQTIDDVMVYANALKIVEGYNISKTMLLNSLLIKAYKNYEFKQGSNFCKNEDFIFNFCNVFEKLNSTIYLDKYDFSNIYIKTFFRDNAIFDFKTQNANVKNASDEFFDSLTNAYFQTTLMQNGSEFIADMTKMSALQEDVGVLSNQFKTNFFNESLYS